MNMELHGLFAEARKIINLEIAVAYSQTYPVPIDSTFSLFFRFNFLSFQDVLFPENHEDMIS